MPPKKCTSICTTKKTLHDCHSDPRCKYANGKLRKYCHLSNKYTFDDKCNIITKVSKNNPIKLPRTRSLPSSHKNEKVRSPSKKQTRTRTRTKRKRTNKQTIKEINPFNIINDYSSSNSSKHVKRNTKRKSKYIIKSDSPVEKTINPFNIINDYSSSNSSKHVKRNMKRKPFTIIETSDTPVQLNPFNFIQGYSSSSSSKHVKRNTHKKPGYIINSSSS